MVGSADALRVLLGPSLVASGLELWDVEMTRDTVRVLVDRPGGIDLEALSAVAGRVVSPLLDDHPELTPDGQFALEVSSPGVERPLRRPEHYARHIGSEVSVKTNAPVEGSRRHQGVLLSADPDGIVLAPAEGGGDTVSIRYAQVERARTVLVWGPAPKPGARKPAVQKVHSPKNPGGSTKAVKRPAANGRAPAAQPVASREKETE